MDGSPGEVSFCSSPPRRRCADGREDPVAERSDASTEKMPSLHVVTVFLTLLVGANRLGSSGAELSGGDDDDAPPPPQIQARLALMQAEASRLKDRTIAAHLPHVSATNAAAGDDAGASKTDKLSMDLHADGDIHACIMSTDSGSGGNAPGTRSLRVVL